jgi:hypothetical protein
MLSPAHSASLHGIARALAAAAAAFAALSCASAPRRLPALADYTEGAGAIAAKAADLFRREGEAPAFRPADNPELLGAAARWLALSGPDRLVESEIVDFPRRPRRKAMLTLRVKLHGHALEDPSERLYADERFDLFLEREARGKAWTLRSSRRSPGVSGEIRRGAPHLREVASEIGLGAARHEPLDPVEKTNICIPATHHHPGVVLADFDGDGSLDILLPSRRPMLFSNDGHGRFRDATRESGLDRLPEGEAAGGVAADLDGDGLPEIFLTYAYSECRLLHNDGRGRFHDITAEAGLAGLSGTYTSAVFFDADGDGRLDLFVADYGDARRTGPAYSGKNGPGNRFFHNVEKEGRPFFVDETKAAGFGDTGWGFAASACDYDGDGRDDLYVANDFGTNVLYHNVSKPGAPHFEEVARKAGVLDDGYGMGVTWGDYDNDGRFDLAVSDFSSPYRWLIRSPRLPMPPQVPALVQAIARPIVVPMLLRRCQGDGLYRNRGDGTFEKTSSPAGVAEGGWAWGTELVDLDGDGREDLLVVNGMWEAAPGGINDEIAFWNGMAVEGIEFHDGYWGGIDFGADGMASQTEKHLYRNLGDGRFEEDAYLEGFDTRADTRGLAVGDLDGDGAPEIVVATFRGPLLVYRNGWNQARRLTLDLRARSPHNRQAIGAVAKLSAGGRTQIREVRAGSSYLSQSAHELSFGLGAAATADEIEVRWPDGSREVRRGVPAGKLVWEEGTAEAMKP